MVTICSLQIKQYVNTWVNTRHNQQEIGTSNVFYIIIQYIRLWGYYIFQLQVFWVTQKSKQIYCFEILEIMMKTRVSAHDFWVTLYSTIYDSSKADKLIYISWF